MSCWGGRGQKILLFVLRDRFEGAEGGSAATLIRVPGWGSLFGPLAHDRQV